MQHTRKQNFLIYMYICHIASKTGYSKYKIFIFYNTKEKPDLKINMTENHKSPFLLKRSQKRGIKTCSLFHRFLFLQYNKNTKNKIHMPCPVTVQVNKISIEQ